MDTSLMTVSQGYQIWWEAIHQSIWIISGRFMDTDQ